jgi:hypothetical protein
MESSPKIFTAGSEEVLRWRTEVLPLIPTWDESEPCVWLDQNTSQELINDPDEYWRDRIPGMEISDYEGYFPAEAIEDIYAYAESFLKEIELGINGSQWGISERIYDFGTGLIHSYYDGELNTYQLNILRYRSIDEMKIWVEKFSIRTCRDAELEDFYDGVFREFSSELPEGVELREKIDSAGDCYDNPPYVDLYTLNNGEFSWFIEAYGYLICRDKNAIRETWSESLSRAFSKKAILSDFMRGD